MGKGRDLKPHIGIFGRRNNGKSSFINAITGVDVAIVSSIAGTTTDPVKKSMEIFGIGPEHILYVGDSGVDMQTANNAGMYAAGALWGFRTKEELTSSGANYLIKNPLDLINIIE